MFLQQLVATDPEALQVGIWDRAGFPLTEDTPHLPAAVRVLPFAYSPAWNPVAPLWDPLKRRVANDTWETLAKIAGVMTGVLQPFWEQVSLVTSLLGDNWLTRGVSDFVNHGNRVVFN